MSVRLSIKEADERFATSLELVRRANRNIAERILFEVQRRLRFLVDVGLDYPDARSLWPQLCQEEKLSAFSWLLILARRWWELSMCSMNLPSVCIPATTID